MSEDLMLGAVHDDTNGSSAEMDFLGESMEGQARRRVILRGKAWYLIVPWAMGIFRFRKVWWQTRGWLKAFRGWLRRWG